MFHSKSFFGIPKKIWVLSVAILIVVPSFDINDLADKYFHNILWFLYLIPTIIFVFKKGSSYGFITTAVESILFLVFESLQDEGISNQELLIFLELILLNILISITVGILVKRNNEKQSELSDAKNLLENIFNHLDLAIWSDNLEGNILISKGIEKVYGQKNNNTKFDPQFWKKAIHPEDKNMISEIEEKLKNHEDYEFIYRILRPDGDIRWVVDRGMPVFNDNGELERYDGTLSDITPERLAKAELEHMAFHDALTGLPNMNYLNFNLAKEFRAAKKNSFQNCIMYFNLDRFKFINDSFGHRFGDRLLRLASQRLVQTIKSVGTVVRAGGDDFIIYLPNTNQNQAKAFAGLLLNAFSKPFHFDEQEIRIAASIGISISEQTESLEGELRKASAALHFAKECGRNQYRFYSVEFYQTANRKMQLEQQLRKALEQQKLEIYYQPKLDLSTNRITGMEALARWNDATIGAVSPTEFIPIAEETGMIVPFGKWVLETACKQNVKWQKMGHDSLHVCVNISSRQFMQDDFVQMIQQTLKQSGLAPEYLNLEITEGIALNNMEEAIWKIENLKRLGISISLDDFGTGYCSLSYIKSLPIDFLKIDRAFIKDITENKQDAAIIDSIISLAHSFDFRVVAEGVEDEQQMEILATKNCDEIQGFYFAKPMPATLFQQFLVKTKERSLC